MLRKEQASSSSSNKHDPSTDVDATDEEHRIQSFVDTVKKLRTPVGVPVYRRLTSKSPQIGINAGPPQRMSTNESGHEGFNHDDEVVKKEELESDEENKSLNLIQSLKLSLRTKHKINKLAMAIFLPWRKRF